MSFSTATAETVESTNFSGRNKAVLLGCVDDAGTPVTCVVKLVHRLESEHTFWAERVAGLIAARLGVFVPPMFVVEVGPEFAEVLEHQLHDGAARSVGPNFGSLYVRDAVPLVSTADNAIDPHLRQQAADMAIFDVFVDNPDRRKDNPNYFIEAAEPPRLVAIDHDLAFTGLYLQVLGSRWPLDILSRHAFAGRFGKNKPDLSRVKHAIAALDDAFLDALTGEVPAVWLTGARATTLSMVVAKLKERRDAIDIWFPTIEAWVEQ